MPCIWTRIPCLLGFPKQVKALCSAACGRMLLAQRDAANKPPISLCHCEGACAKHEQFSACRCTPTSVGCRRSWFPLYDRFVLAHTRLQWRPAATYNGLHGERGRSTTVCRSAMACDRTRTLWKCPSTTEFAWSACKVRMALHSQIVGTARDGFLTDCNRAHIGIECCLLVASYAQEGGRLVADLRTPTVTSQLLRFPSMRYACPTCFLHTWHPPPGWRSLTSCTLCLLV
jgi:hypothetical protein